MSDRTVTIARVLSQPGHHAAPSPIYLYKTEVFGSMVDFEIMQNSAISSISPHLSWNVRNYSFKADVNMGCRNSLYNDYGTVSFGRGLR